MFMPKDYVERVYAGWLGKVIGVRYGAPVENWSAERIQTVYGPVSGYLESYKNFAADDDTNGPIFFLRAIDDYGLAATTEQMGHTWLNYAPFEHGFYWWGGYGISTEHTAYLNLRADIPAPRSGSAAQNGTDIAEQIGGQIFSDVWGLIAPGRPDVAAEYAGRMASVSHDGEGVYGGRFIAACIAAAFVQPDMESLLRAGLAQIPEDSAYHAMVLEIMAEYARHPDDWRATFRYVQQHHGYDKYAGVCHIIPNSAVIVLSLLHGANSFDDALSICNMCGWDTDCNVANVGTIMGVLLGLDAIDETRWRRPIGDFLAASSVMGSLNIMNLPQNALYIAELGYALAGEAPPAPWADILAGRAPQFHFLLPGSTHAFRVRGEFGKDIHHSLFNVEDPAAGGRCLKLVAPGFASHQGEGLRLYYQTYYEAADFDDSRYDPAFSPVCYPGQTLRATLRCDEALAGVKACLYVYDKNSGRVIEGAQVPLAGEYTGLTYRIPPMEGACIKEAGVILRAEPRTREKTLCAWLKGFDIGGAPDYTVDFAAETMDAWHGLHVEVSQFTRLKGIWRLEGGVLAGSCADFAEAYTGDVGFGNYRATTTLCPRLGGWHGFNLRVQGAVRSYAVVLQQGGTLALMKNANGYSTLCETKFDWRYGEPYTLTVEAVGSTLTVLQGGKALLQHTDTEAPYLHGAVGFSLRNGSRCDYSGLRVQGTETEG